MDNLKEELVEIHEETVTRGLLDSMPPKSKKIYWAQYDKFISWCTQKNISEYTENVLLEYFNEESKKVKSQTLCARYSMLKSTLAISKNIDISKYKKLIAYLKRENDGYQPKRSKFFEKEELEAFLNGAPDNEYLFMKVVAIMGIAGACRRYELANMTLDNIQDIGSAIIVTIPDTRTGMERSVTIKDNRNMKYLQILRKYMELRPYCDHCRLFVNYSGGRCTRQPVGVHKFGRIPSEIADYLKLPDATDYTGHSFRRTSSTLIVDPRCSITSPRQLSGWKSATLPEGYSSGWKSATLPEGCSEQSIQAKLEIARKVLGFVRGKEAEDCRTSEIAVCSSKTPKPQTFSDDRREPCTSNATNLSKNWPAHTQQSSASINLTESYEQFGIKTFTESTSRSISAGTEIEGIGRHISENSAQGKWEPNETEKDDDDSNSLSDVTDMNLSLMLLHGLSSSKSISTQNIDTDDSNQQRAYLKAAHSVPKTRNTFNEDQCTSHNEADNASVRKASTGTILTDNIRNIEMVVIRLQAEKLLLELDKLKLQRDKMKAEKHNIHLRSSVLSLQKQLILIEFSDKADTGSIIIPKTCCSNVDTSSSSTDVVNTKSKTDSCVPSNLVQNEEDPDSDIEIEYISMNQLCGRYSNILGCGKNVANFPEIQAVRHAENTKQVSKHSVNVIDNISQKMYPSKSVLSDNRIPITGNTVTSSEEDLVTEVSHKCYSDTSESGHNSQEMSVTDQNPMRVNEMEHKYEIDTQVISTMDRSKEKEIQKLSPLYQHNLTKFTKSTDFHENNSVSGTNNTKGKKRKRETDVGIVPTSINKETLLVRSNIESQFAFIDIRKPNFVLKKENDLDFDSKEVSNDSLIYIGELGDI